MFDSPSCTPLKSLSNATDANPPPNPNSKAKIRQNPFNAKGPLNLPKSIHMLTSPSSQKQKTKSPICVTTQLLLNSSHNFIFVISLPMPPLPLSPCPYVLVSALALVNALLNPAGLNMKFLSISILLAIRPPGVRGFATLTRPRLLARCKSSSSV